MIHAPFSGRITALFVRGGEEVQAHQPLLELFDVSAPEVRAQVPTTYIAPLQHALRHHQIVTATADWHGTPLQLTLLNLKR